MLQVSFESGWSPPKINCVDLNQAHLNYPFCSCQRCDKCLVEKLNKHRRWQKSLQTSRAKIQGCKLLSVADVRSSCSETIAILGTIEVVLVSQGLAEQLQGWQTVKCQYPSQTFLSEQRQEWYSFRQYSCFVDSVSKIQCKCWTAVLGFVRYKSAEKSEAGGGSTQKEEANNE